ncbi:recombinase family protein [Vallitalea guaymasensis]|uniref:recombinase family protein n=1 Tax=Vallitalea guaymasensis TaxID=1185412 RepID=UPI00272A5AA9|nr:recombinase family protein [Vallitalea guaymasensis]
MQKAALYIRVSTDEQTEYSPSAQKTALLEYANKNNYLVQDEHIFIDEGISGRIAEKRPGFMRMIGLAKSTPHPFDAILIHKFDRFARNREDSVVYKSLLRKECGIKVISITEHIEDDKFAIILESMLEAMAEYYSLNLSDEVKKGMIEKAKRGEHSGTCPIGYKLDKSSKTLLIDNKYSNMIRLIFNIYTNDNKSLYEIAKNLNLLGYRTKKKKLFSKRSIEYIIKNPVYYGYNRWNYRKGGNNIPNSDDQWIIEKAQHEPIIEKELWDRAQLKFNKNKAISSTHSRPINEKKHWLSSLLRCSSCGSTMSANKVKGKYINFRCSKYFEGSCNTPNYISGRKIENYVLKKLEKDLDNFRDINISKKDSSTSFKSEDITLLQQQLKRISKKYELANKSYLEEIDTLKEYEANKRNIDNEKNRLIEKLEKLKIEESQNKNDSIMHISSPTDLLYLDNSSIVTKHKIAKSFIKQIVFNSKENTIIIDLYLD